MNDALLLVDVIDDFRHEDGEALLRSFRRRQPRLARAIAAARGRIPVVYANDMRNRWDSDAPGYVEDVCRSGLGGDLVAEVAPADDDVFVFKPRYSAFDSTPLEILLRRLETERVLLAGNATEMCVTQTAIAARELGFKVTVYPDCCATLDPRLEHIALQYLARVVGARIERGDVSPRERQGTPASRPTEEVEMPGKKHGPSIKDPDQYEALRRKGTSNERAARISNESAGSSRSKVGRRGGSARDYDERTNEQLLRRARQVGIKGRSKMTKRELLSALRNH